MSVGSRTVQQNYLFTHKKEACIDVRRFMSALVLSLPTQQ